MVRPGAGQQVDIFLGDSVTVLDPVTVEARYTPYLAQGGFNQRRQTSLAHFLDTTDVKKSGPVRFDEAFREVSGAQLRPDGPGLMITLQRCSGRSWKPTLA